jgi:subtilase family serine protease
MAGLTSSSSCKVGGGSGQPCFQQVHAQKGQYRSDSGWGLETSLDIEWAHAIAPAADIVLVEGQTSSFSNLFAAVDQAVTTYHAKVVSMSWGAGDFSGETAYDSYFNKSGVTFVASSGDSGSGALYPASSPYVVGVGGTSLPLDANGNLTGAETAWNGSGGGTSLNELEPGYQASYGIASAGRGVPDVAYDADPNTGVSVYDSSYNGHAGWFQVGGTSAGAPQWAALVALADQRRPVPLSSNNLASSPVYAAASAGDFRDIVSGTNGSCGVACSAAAGYDYVTGLGSPVASKLVPYLANN